ncbi:hypothetical protein D3C85_1643630 [compost metagenome]
MRFILRVAAASNLAANKIVVAAAIHTDNQHIHIVVAIGTCIALFIQLRYRQIFYRIPIILYIPCGSIHVSARFADPLVHIIFPPIASGE